MNKDQTQSGFLEANGRITAMKMRGVVSCGLFLPLSSLTWAGNYPSKVGESFGEIGKNKICSRYNPPSKQQSQGGKTSTKGKTSPKFIAPYFEKHIDTSQFKYNVSSIQKGSVLYFHAKRHGTSARQQLGKVEKKLPNWKNAINSISYKLLGKNVFSPISGYEVVIGSRNVLINDRDTKNGYYGTDDFRFRAAEMITPHLRKGMTVYSEIVGYVGGSSTIMPDHTTTKLGCKESVKKYGESIRYSYGCREGELRNIIYRITLTTDDGMVMDMPQKALEAWCSQRGLEHTLEIHPPIIYDGDEDALRELVERLTERPDCLTECYDSPSQISEGIIIREECGTLIPKFYKSKSNSFRIMEGLQTVADMEESS